MRSTSGTGSCPDTCSSKGVNPPTACSPCSDNTPAIAAGSLGKKPSRSELGGQQADLAHLLEHPVRTQLVAPAGHLAHTPGDWRAGDLVLLDWLRLLGRSSGSAPSSTVRVHPFGVCHRRRPATGEHIDDAARCVDEGGSRGATRHSHQMRCEYHVGVVEQGVVLRRFGIEHIESHAGEPPGLSAARAASRSTNPPRPQLIRIVPGRTRSRNASSTR